MTNVSLNYICVDGLILSTVTSDKKNISSETFPFIASFYNFFISLQRLFLLFIIILFSLLSFSCLQRHPLLFIVLLLSLLSSFSFYLPPLVFILILFSLSSSSSLYCHPLLFNVILFSLSSSSSLYLPSLCDLYLSSSSQIFIVLRCSHSFTSRKRHIWFY